MNKVEGKGQSSREKGEGVGRKGTRKDQKGKEMRSQKGKEGLGNRGGIGRRRSRL